MPRANYMYLTSLGYSTALIGLGIGLQMPLSFLKDGPKTDFTPSSVLVLGGSSAVGAAAIQLLRIAMPSCTILATSSPQHHKHITDYLGADVALDRSSRSLVAEVKSAIQNSRAVDAIIDAVGAGGSQTQIFEAFDPNGPRRYAQVWTGDEEIKTPDGVNSVLFRGRDMPRLQGNRNVMLALEKLLEEQKYKLPLPVARVGRGLEGLVKALDMMRSGVSGEKLVVST